MVYNHPRGRRVSGKKNFHSSLARKSRWLCIPAGLLALVWFCVRVIPKPSRITYPCQKVAAPMAVSFLGLTASWVAAAFSFQKARDSLRGRRVVFTALFLAAGMCALAGMVAFTYQDTQAAGEGLPTGSYTPSDAPNTPMGTARGIMPGRVAWVHDPAASTYTGAGYWWEDAYNNQDAIDMMLDDVVMSVANRTTVAAAWDALFRDFNLRKTGTASAYQAGQDIAIKVNLNCSGSGNKIDASPHLVKSLLRQLRTAGVAQADIAIFDAARTTTAAIAHIKAVCQTEFPNVNYNTIHTTFSTGKVSYSHTSITASEVTRLPTFVFNAPYFINMAVLKRHCEISSAWQSSNGQTALTLNAKNMFGVFTSPSALHERIRDWYWGMNTYTPLVDLMSNQYLGQNTVLNVIDGLYAASRHDAVPVTWSMTPFNGDYPKSVFASQDQVALESVGLDFLHGEMPQVANADNYLHEAARIGAPASGTNYVGKALGSLGVHEHWNNTTDKKYTRNLGTGSGIELVAVRTPMPPTPPVITGPASLSDGTTGTTYSATFTASGTAPITWSVTSGALPAGMSLNASTGAYTGTPAAAGACSFTVQATNSLGSDSRAFTHSIIAAPVIKTYEAESGTLSNGAKKVAASFCSGGYKVGQLGGTSKNGTVIINNVSAAVAGSCKMTVYYISSNNRTFYVTVNSGSSTPLNCTGSGSWSIVSTIVMNVTLQAGNNSIRFDNPTKAYAPDLDKITIESSSLPPTPAVITGPASLADGAVGTVFSATFTASGTAPITWSVTSGSLPAGMSLNSSTGLYSGTPTDAGACSFTVQAANSQGSDSKACTHTIIAYPAVITGPASLSGGTTGSAFSATFTASGTAPITWSVASGALPTGMSLNASTGVYSGTPTVAGSYSFSIQASNSTGSDIKAYSHTIADAPVVTIYEAENALLSGPVVASNKAGFTGTGFADYINASADYIEWTVTAATAGQNTLKFRYANGGTTSRPLLIAVNGATVASSLAFPATGAWTTWSTVSLTANLNAGTNKVRATAIGSSGGNVDHLEVTPAASPAPYEEAPTGIVQKQGGFPFMQRAADVPVYDVQGRRIRQSDAVNGAAQQSMIPGRIYIRDGKKVVPLSTK